MSLSPFEKLEPMIVNLMQEAKLPGLSMAVVVDGKPVYAKAFGARNLSRNLPMTTETLFGIGSISKSFTAFAILQLVEQGKINLNDPVSKHIDFKLGNEETPITIHHLLSHSSGIPSLQGGIVAITRGLGDTSTMIPLSSREDFFHHINMATTEVFDEPGKHFFYNNDMFTTLGLIIERITNVSFEEYVRENILNPLGMVRSTYLCEEFEADSDRITGYIPLKEGIKGFKPPFSWTIYAPGGILSSVREMQNYLLTLLNGGTFNGIQVLQPSSIEQMWTPAIKIPAETGYGQGDAWYGYGWGIEKDFFGYTLVQHGGNIATSSAFLAMIPEKKMGVILGVNGDQSGILGGIARGLLAELLGEDMNQAVPLFAVQQKLQQLVGKYRSYRGILQGEVYLQGNLLFVKYSIPLLPDPIVLPLAPENLDELKFSVPVVFPNQKTWVQFHVDEETGKVHVIFDRNYLHKL